MIFTRVIYFRGDEKKELYNYSKVSLKKKSDTTATSVDFTFKRRLSLGRVPNTQIFKKDDYIIFYAKEDEYPQETDIPIVSGKIEKITHKRESGKINTKIKITDSSKLMLNNIVVFPQKTDTWYNVVNEVISQSLYNTNGDGTNTVDINIPNLTHEITYTSSDKTLATVLSELTETDYTNEDYKLPFYVIPVIDGDGNRRNKIEIKDPSELDIYNKYISETDGDITKYEFKKNSSDDVFQIIYSCGKNIDGNTITYYYVNPNSTPEDKQIKKPFEFIMDGLVSSEIQSGNLIQSDTGDIFYDSKNYNVNTSYPFTPSFSNVLDNNKLNISDNIEDYKTVTNFDDYTKAFQYAAQIIGRAEAKKFVSEAIWEGKISYIYKDVDIGENILCRFKTFDLFLPLRVKSINYQFGKTNRTTLTLEEDIERV